MRLDSGDLEDLSRKARRILDQAGFGDIAIVASGNLDEYRIAELVDAGAPIDAFGVGTALAVSDDAPSADFVYKLVEYKDRGRLKTSTGKSSTPGRKQLFRAYAPSGSFFADMVGIVDEGATTVAREFKPVPSKTVQLMETVFENGRRIMPRPTLAEARERVMNGLTDPRRPLQGAAATGGVSGAADRGARRADDQRKAARAKTSGLNPYKPAVTPATNGVVRSGGGESRSFCAAAVRWAESKVTSNGLTTSRRGCESGVHRVGAG